MKQHMAVAAFAAVIGASAPLDLSAQERRGLRELRSPVAYVGGGITIANPTGAFGDIVDLGGGINLFASVHPGSSPLGLRMEADFLVYGSEEFVIPLRDDFGRVFLDVNTTNTIAQFGIGPQLIMGTGPVQPYAFGTIGFSYFSTQTSLSGTADVEPFASSTNFDDFTFSAAAGGGLMLRVSNGKNPVSIDLAASYYDNGRTRYLREGSITDLPDGSLRIRAYESKTNMVQFRIGVSVGIY